MTFTHNFSKLFFGAFTLALFLVAVTNTVSAVDDQVSFTAEGTAVLTGPT